MSRETTVSESETTLLNSPGITVPEPGLLSSFFVNTVLLLTAWAGAFGCFLTAFDIAADRVQLLSWGVCFALICAGQYLPKRRRWILPLCTLSAWGLALWRCFETVGGGALRVVNTMLSAYTERLNVREALPQFPVEELPAEEESLMVTVFTVFLAFLFFWLLSLLWVRLQSLLGAFALTGLFLLSHLGVSIVPDRWTFGILLVFWAFLLFAAPSLRQRQRLVEQGSSFQASGRMFLQPASLLLLPILAGSMLLLYTLFPPETHGRPQFIDDLRTQLNNSLNLQTVFRGDTGHKDRVDFTALGNRSHTGKSAMQVRYQWENGVPTYADSPVSQKSYLKDFVGSVYTGTSWEQLSSEDAKQLRRIWREKNVQTLTADLMQSMPMDSDPDFSYSVSVRKLNVNSQSIYSPYGLDSPSGPPDGMKYINDGFLAASSTLSGLGDYTLSAAAIPALDDLPFYKDRVSAYLEHLAEVSPYVSSVNAEAVAKRIKKSMYRSADGDPWQMPSWLRELLPAETLSEVIDPLEQYNKFAYSRYTQVPDDLQDVLARYSEEHGLSPELAQEDRISYLQQVKQVLAEECVYSWTPPVLPDDTDFVTHFLTESRTGYCVHFATAAAMLLRFAGIPARYAEGYAVSTETAGTDWIDVPDYNFHAWVEVYWGGIGWIPVEMTPSGDSVPAAYANAAGPSENDNLINALPVPSPTPSISFDPEGRPMLWHSFPPLPDDFESPSETKGKISPSPSPTPAPDSQEDDDFLGIELLHDGRLTFFGLLLLLVLLILALTLLIWTQRLIRLSKRKRSFRQPDRNKAALCVYSHLSRLYWENRLLPHGTSTPPEEIEALAMKARFSNHTLTEEELALLTDQASAMEKKLKAGLPKGEWLRCKYLRILF